LLDGMPMIVLHSMWLLPIPLSHATSEVPKQQQQQQQQ
jgi:hypothetical protein